MTSIYLVRHAQALGNVLKRFQGRTDHPLTENGRKQVVHVANRFRALPVHAVYTSPLQRAYDTARGIAAPHGLVPIRETGLLEIDGGNLEDWDFDDLTASHPRQFHYFLEEPHSYQGDGGETYYQVFDRMQDTVQGLARLHRDQTIVLVSHGCSLRCLLCWAMGLDIKEMNSIPWMGNTAVSHLTFQDDRPSVAYHSDTAHLPQT